METMGYGDDGKADGDGQEIRVTWLVAVSRCLMVGS